MLDRIIDASNPQEPVHLYYPGDDLLTPLARRRGLPIGNLTSQLFANVYLDRFDHFVTEVLSAPYLRYVDDFALFADDPARLVAWRDRTEAFLARRRLSLHPAKTHVAATSAPATFLGFELRPGGRRRLPEANVRRFRNRLRGLRDRWRAGTVTRGEVEQRVGRLGGARGARRHVAVAPCDLPGRVVRAARTAGPGGLTGPRPPLCCAAAPGTTMPRTSGLARATGTPPATGTTTRVFVFRARPEAGAGAVTAASGARGSVQGRS